MSAIIAMANTRAVAQVAKMLGVTVKTVWRWDREGRLKPADQVVRFRQESYQARPRQRVAYCRVSSPSRRPDLKNQR